MTFRTPAEAVELANNTAYGLAASVWSESVNVALQVAAQIKAGVVWVNSTNLFDAACGFGGYRESGFGREGGREGMREYLEPAWLRKAPQLRVTPQRRAAGSQRQTQRPDATLIDRTVKLYIGGKQVRPDSGYSFECRSASGALLGQAPLGNRKDIRNAVEAARRAQQWSTATTHQRAQVLYYAAENLTQRGTDVAARLAAVVGRKQAADEVRLGIERLFTYAAWTDKYEGDGALAAFQEYLGRHERSDRYRGRDLSCGGAAAWLPVVGAAAGGGGQLRDCGALGQLSARSGRPLPAV